MMPQTTSTSLVDQLSQLRLTILRMGRFLSDPEELFQETALACHRKKNVNWSIEHPDYIIRSAKDQLAQLRRRALSRISPVPFEARMTELPDPHNEFGRIHAGFRFEVLYRAIEQLSAGYRQVFIKRAVNEMPFPQIAIELGIKECTVRQRWRRGLSQLRHSLLLADPHRSI